MEPMGLGDRLDWIGLGGNSEEVGGSRRKLRLLVSYKDSLLYDLHVRQYREGINSIGFGV